jgi:hypothetical protein
MVLMSFSAPRTALVFGVCALPLALLLSANPAQAQFYGGYGGGFGGGYGGGFGNAFDPCCPPPVACAPIVQCQPVAQLVPVPQTCYQTVPVTEYREQTVTVQRPVVETKYVEQPVTEYVPVTETRTAEVPHVTYQTVNECQTVTRDMGRWITQRQCIHRPSPCEYDPRPGFAGWWNRTTYNVRSTFAPKYATSRFYAPNLVTQTVPTQRLVAQHGTRQVSYNVTRYEARHSTRKVAVNSVRMVAEEVKQTVPVTVMRTVPTGTTTAWLPSDSPAAIAYLSGNTATALNPSPDPAGARSADGSDPSRTADRRNDPTDRFDRAPTSGEKFNRTTAPATPKAFDSDKSPFDTGAVLPGTDSGVRPTAHEMPAIPPEALGIPGPPGPAFGPSAPAVPVPHAIHQTEGDVRPVMNTTVPNMGPQVGPAQFGPAQFGPAEPAAGPSTGSNVGQPDQNQNLKFSGRVPSYVQSTPYGHQPAAQPTGQPAAPVSIAAGTR